MIKKILSGLFFCLLASSVFAGQGWYLLVPWSTNPPLAPIAEWDHHASFDTAAACEKELRAQIDIRDELKKVGKGTTQQLKTNQLIRERLNWARCIASDDLRLKK